MGSIGVVFLRDLLVFLGGFSKLEPLNALENDVHVPKTKGKEHRRKSKVQDDKNGTISLPVPVKRRRLRVVD